MRGIYKITSPIGMIYIGQSIAIERRKKEHESRCNKNDTPALLNSFKKHGFTNHQFEILEIVDEKIDKSLAINILNGLEQKYIKEYDCIHPFGLNLSIGGYNRILTEETKQKISKSHIGIIPSEESKRKGVETRNRNGSYVCSDKQKAAVSKAHKGKKYSIETRQKMSKAAIGRNKGRRHSPEVIAKMTLLKIGRHTKKAKAVNQYSLSGEYIQTYRSITEATKAVNAGSWDISNTCHGRQKTCKGFIWKFN